VGSSRCSIPTPRSKVHAAAAKRHPQPEIKVFAAPESLVEQPSVHHAWREATTAEVITQHSSFNNFSKLTGGCCGSCSNARPAATPFLKIWESEYVRARSSRSSHGNLPGKAVPANYTSRCRWHRNVLARAARMGGCARPRRSTILLPDIDEPPVVAPNGLFERRRCRASRRSPRQPQRWDTSGRRPNPGLARIRPPHVGGNDDAHQRLFDTPQSDTCPRG